MALGAAHAKRMMEKKKQQAIDAILLEEKGKADDMLSKFDMEETGELTQIELKHMMQYMNKDIEPNEEMVHKVFSAANSRGMEGLDIAEIVEAIITWEDMIEDSTITDKVFKDFDVRDIGALDIIQVKECLYELTGKAPNDLNILKNLLIKANVEDENYISKPSLKILIELWFLECNPKEAASIEAKSEKEKNERLKRANKIRSMDEKMRAKKWVSQFNKDKSGKLTIDEISDMMKFMNNNKSPTNEEVNHIFKQANIRYSSNLDLQEAMLAASIWKNMIDEMNFIENIFQKYDVDDNGLLEFNELKLCLIELYDNKNITDDDVSNLIQQINVDGSGAVSLDELKPALETWFANTGAHESIHHGNKSSACLVM